MNLLIDLFAGLGGWETAFEDDDEWDVVSVDFDEDFDVDIHADVSTLRPDDFDTEGYDLVVVVASPPCTTFSIAAIGTHQNKVGPDHFKPKTDKARKHVALAHYTFYLIRSIDPDFWFVENPERGILSKYTEPPEARITWCQYGYEYMKPTSLWGNHPDSFPYLECYNGDTCHIGNKRGGDNWGEGREDSKKRAKIPHGLSQAVKWSVENPDAFPHEYPHTDGGQRSVAEFL